MPSDVVACGVIEHLHKEHAHRVQIHPLIALLPDSQELAVLLDGIQLLLRGKHRKFVEGHEVG